MAFEMTEWMELVPEPGDLADLIAGRRGGGRYRDGMQPPEAGPWGPARLRIRWSEDEGGAPGKEASQP